jgi:O-antigen ligase
LWELRARRDVLQEKNLVSFMKNGSLYLALLMAPYFFILPFGVNITPFDLVLLAMGGASLLAFIAKGRSKIRMSKRDILLAFSMGFFTIAAIGSSLRAPDMLEAVKGTISYLLIFLLLFLVMNTNIDRRNLGTSLKVLCLGWTMFLLYNLTIFRDPTWIIGGRYTSLYSKPGAFANTIALIFPLVVHFSLDRKSHLLVRAICLPGSVLCLFFIFISGSRGAFIGLAGAVCLYVMLAFRVSARALLLVMLLIVINGYIFMEYSGDFERNVIFRMLKEDESGEGGNLESRLEHYRTVVDLLPNLLLIGYGLNNGDQVMERFGGRTRAHNFVFALVLEVGVIGTTAMLGLVVLCFAGAWKMLIAKRQTLEFLALQAAIISAAFGFVVLCQFMAPPVHRGFWVFVALSYHVRKLMDAEEGCFVGRTGCTKYDSIEIEGQSNRHDLG